MSEFKKTAVIFCIVIGFSAAAVSCSLKELGRCIKDINSTSEENVKISENIEEKRVFGNDIGNISFLNAETCYNVAENGNCIYYFCKNQYLEVWSGSGAVRYFCYDRAVGDPAYSESECSHIARTAVKECLMGTVQASPQIANAAFDGKGYTYYVSLGDNGWAIVRVAADSGKVLLFDGRNINNL